MTGLESHLQEPYQAWKHSPSPETTGQLLRAVEPTLSTALRTYGSGDNPVLRARAKSLAIDAFDTYDPQRGAMKAHLMSNLQRLQRINAQQRQIVQMPERVAMDRLRTDQAAVELEDRLGRPPSDVELSDYTGLSPKRLAYIRQARRPIAEGTLTQMRDDRGGYAPSVVPLTPQDEAWVEFVHGDLNPTDQFILERMLGLHGHKPMSPGEIARRLQLSPGAISQRMAKIQMQLDRRDELEAF